MKTKDELSFTYLNYYVCVYCKNLVVASHRDGWNYGCGIKYVDDKYYLGIDKLDNALKGCGDFEVSGFPAHPEVFKELIKLNSKAKKIPVDESATETSWEFGSKLERFLPKESNKGVLEIK